MENMLTQQQIECIEYLCIGTLKMTEIADRIGCTDRVIRKWKKENEEFKAELQKRSLDYESGLIDTGKSIMARTLGDAIEVVISIAKDKKEDSDIRLKASKIILDKVIADAKPPVEDTTEGKQQEKPKDIKAILKEIGADNVIDISKAK